MNEQQAIEELRKIYIELNDCKKYPPFEIAENAMEKQIRKKFIYPKRAQESYRCPSCNVDLGFTDGYFGDLETMHFCKNCGQRLGK